MVRLRTVVALVAIGALLMYSFVRGGQMRSTASAPAAGFVSVVAYHGHAIAAWRDMIRSGKCRAGAALVHVDKHADMEPPWVVLEPDVQPLVASLLERLGPTMQTNISITGFTHPCSSHCRMNCSCFLRNNNFITTAAMDGIIDQILWLYPDFPCSQCGYGRSQRHSCLMARATDDGCVTIQRERSQSQRNDSHRTSALSCAENVETARDTPSLAPMARGLRRHYTLEVSSVSSALGADHSVNNERVLSAQSLRDDADWILDVDLDFLVPDEESPKARNIQMYNLDSSSSELPEELARQVFDWDAVEQAKRWACKAMTALTDLCAVSVQSQLVGGRPLPLQPHTVRSRLSHVERLLTTQWGARRPPCAVTIARSLEGGYTPIAHTRLLEEQVVAMIRRVFHSRHWRYDTSRTVLTTVLDELSRRIEAARRPSPSVIRSEGRARKDAQGPD